MSELHRSSYAIRKDLQPGLDKAITTMGLQSIGELLSMIARDPARAAIALKPLADALQADKDEAKRLKQAQADVKKLARTADPEAVAKALAILNKAQK
jgi:hypothetical protein